MYRVLISSLASNRNDSLRRLNELSLGFHKPLIICKILHNPLINSEFLRSLSLILHVFKKQKKKTTINEDCLEKYIELIRNILKEMFYNVL